MCIRDSCKAVQDELGIKVLTGMYEENPGADLKDKILIVATTNSAAGMRKAAPTMAALALKLMKNEELGASCEDGYMPNGIRRNFFEKERGSTRAVKMLLNKLAGKPFTTCLLYTSFSLSRFMGTALADRMPCAAPIRIHYIIYQKQMYKSMH